MTREEILHHLTAPSAANLFAEARQIRQSTKGNGIFLRGLIELSSICQRNCLYCDMRHDNPKVHRYAMQDDEIVACAALAAQLDFGTVVLQAGECERLLTRERVSTLIRRIKAETGQKVTLSLGERSEADTAEWKAAGADRYLRNVLCKNRSCGSKAERE